jgi:hypothetical protein
MFTNKGRAMGKQATVAKYPQSWSIEDWPQGVYPRSSKEDDEDAIHKIRWLVRSQRDELMKAGALVRVGRQLVILGPAYCGWLAKQSSHAAVPKRDSAHVASAAA